MRKLVLGLSLLVFSLLAIGPALAGGQHSSTDHFTGDKYELGLNQVVRYDTYFDGKAAFRNRVMDAVDKIDTNTTGDLSMTDTTTVYIDNNTFHNALTSLLNFDCSDQPWTFGDINGHPVVGMDDAVGSLNAAGVTFNCDKDGDGRNDWWLIALDPTPFSYSWNAQTSESVNDLDFQGIVTHEALHGFGFNGHWTDSYCVDKASNGVEIPTMCDGFIIVLTAQNVKFDFGMRSLAHDDTMELREAFGGTVS